MGDWLGKRLDGATARLSAFLVVLALVTAGGWAAGRGVGPVRVPDAPVPGYTHLDGAHGHMDMP